MYVTRSSSGYTKLKTYSSNIPAAANLRTELREFSIEGFGNIGQVAFNSKGTTLYFVSDAPGGSGGLDIYSSDLVGGR